MRKLLPWVLPFVLAALAPPLFAATAADFYVGLLRRGATEVEAGRNESAVTPLRLAAFGLVDSIEHYQTAQAYLVVALDRMNQSELAREAALRIVSAERIERRFASLALPTAIRTAFTTAARKLLPAADAAMLLNAGTAATTRPAPLADPPSRPVVEKPAPTTTQPSTATQNPAPTQNPTTQNPTTQNPTTQNPTTQNPTSQSSSAQSSSPQSSSPRSSSTQPPPTQPSRPATTPSQPPAPQQPATRNPQPQPQPATRSPQPATPANTPSRLAAGERALIAANLPEARRIYRELLDAGNHDHATWIRVAEGLYRSRDFSGALAAFQRVGALRAGEEAYRYYVAVALYETGQYDRARRELAAALPHIEVTPDVQRYRTKIESAR